MSAIVCVCVTLCACARVCVYGFVPVNEGSISDSFVCS